MWPAKLNPTDDRVRVRVIDGVHHAAGPRVDGGWLVAIVSPGDRERAIAARRAWRDALAVPGMDSPVTGRPR